MMLYELFLFGLLSGITTWLFGFGGGFVANLYVQNDSVERL
ncbi:putative permease, partial [Acinetobacter baumannii 45002_8]